MNDDLLARGAVDIHIYEDGAKVGRLCETNLVVTLGKKNVARLLGGDAIGKAITKVGVGTNGAAADVADASLTNGFTKAITSVSYPADNSVMFSFDIDNSEANGKEIAEFALLNDSGVLFARKVRSATITKTNAIRLVGTWTITIN